MRLVFIFTNCILLLGLRTYRYLMATSHDVFYHYIFQTGLSTVLDDFITYYIIRNIDSAVIIYYHDFV